MTPDLKICKRCPHFEQAAAVGYEGRTNYACHKCGGYSTCHGYIANDGVRHDAEWFKVPHTCPYILEQLMVDPNEAKTSSL